MAPAISDFSVWVDQPEESGAGGNLVSVLTRIASDVQDRFAAQIWFARILGRRWSFIAGEIGSPAETRPINLTRGYGMIIGNQGSLDSAQLDSLVCTLNRLLAREAGEILS